MIEHSKINVLVVEDDNYMNSLISRFMESEGYKVDSYMSYKDAVKTLKRKKNKYDVLIVDYRLTNSNGKSGLDFHDKIREVNPDIKTVMISGFGSYAVKKDAFKKGVTRFLDKPFFLEELSFSISH